MLILSYLEMHSILSLADDLASHIVAETIVGIETGFRTYTTQDPLSKSSGAGNHASSPRTVSALA